MARKQYNIDFVGNRKRFFIISGTIIALALILSFVFGVSLDIKFKGGSMLTYSYVGEVDANAFKETAEDTLNKEFSITESEDVATGKKNIVLTLVGTQGLTVDEQATLNTALTENYPDNEIVKEQDTNVDASMGREFLFKCVVAILFAFLVIVLYIAIRFRKIGGWSAGVVGIIALLHDAVIVYFIFVLFRIPLNDNFMAVILTILGYSINDTIVIYDRIRENRRKMPNAKFSDNVNTSLNQMIGRSINTSITTVTAMVIVLIVALLYGADSIVTFALPMIFGMLSGVYSSLCLTGPLWVTWTNYRNKKQQDKGKPNGSLKKKKA